MAVVRFGKSSMGTRDARAPVHPLAGVCAGAAAGLLYLALQMLLSGMVVSGDPWLPLERIAAMLMGPDIVGSDDSPLVPAGMALIVHLGVSVVYGRLVDLAVRDAPPLKATLIGAAVGAALYLLAFRIVAPFAFPWFADSPAFITISDHILFGAVAGLACSYLRRRWPLPATAARDDRAAG